jgi:uncharacterized protein
LEELAALCLFAFLAGLVDAVSGGGGLIQIPALFAVFPTTSAVMLIGTNKLAAICGTAVALLRYARAVPISWQVMRLNAAVALVAGMLGAWTVARVPASALRPVVLALLLMVVAYTLLRPRLGLQPSQGARHPWLERSYCAVLGFYDGFFGPGAGAFLLFGFVRWFGRTFLEAAAATKVINLASNTGALLWFSANGHIDLAAGIPMALANIAGSYLGASAAVRKGARFIRRVFIAVVTALTLKIAYDLMR